VFTTACHRSLSWARLIQSTSSQPISPTTILILSSHLRQVFRVVLFPQVFQPKSCQHISSPPCALHDPPINIILLDLIILIISYGALPTMAMFYVHFS
jgi:hypothetical protein